jgi:prepilin-type N-terminal cleavage/methylation domain-containing protein
MNTETRGFTLIEVMLAVAIFAFAVVGFGVALNDVLGVNSEILRTAQRRQAIESVAAQILARSKNFQESGWTVVPGWGSEKTWTISQRAQRVLVNVPGPNNVTVPLEGWWRVELRAQDEKEKVVDQIGFILWGQR